MCIGWGAGNAISTSAAILRSNSLCFNLISRGKQCSFVPGLFVDVEHSGASMWIWLVRSRRDKCQG